MTTVVRRPTEDAALAAASRSPRPSLSLPLILAELISANRTGDRHGVNLLAHRAARVSLPEVGE
ncbi:hypothetical protein ACIO3O_19585 [Streptomyces sp. NPDC087440]|uniref:hypothetical protein n=1 Tax=Streptomyces sp. NPDC087440 TaxID=3365790 RepID=UPI003810CEAC